MLLKLLKGEATVRVLFSSALGLAILVYPSELPACSLDPFLFQLPGETVEQVKARSKQIWADFSVIHHYQREKYAFENARAIYLGRIISKLEWNYKTKPWTLPSTTVQPVAKLKGNLPSGKQVLTDEAQTGACTDYGDGHGAWGKVGDLVIVFVGLPKSRERPNGIDSFKPSDIRTVELLDALRDFGKDIEDEVDSLE